MIEERMQAISIALDDLIFLSKHDDKILEDLYYNRDTELTKFKSYIQNLKTSSDNILIQGEAGIGKSCFVYKLASDKMLLNEYSVYPIIIDYSKISPRSVPSSLMYFLKQIFTYFEEMSIPCNSAKAINEDNIIVNFHALTDHLRDYEGTNLSKHCLVFIDDIDYAENDWYELLKFFMPLSVSPLISIVLTVRPHLYSAIESYDDRISYFFTRNVKEIQLEPLAVENLLSSRLAPLLVEKEDKPLHRFIRKLFSRNSRLSSIIRKYGIKNFDDLARIEYPFTEKHNNFMARISNGNIREIFDIAYESFSYILNNPGLEEREEGGIQRKVIGRNGVMKMFFDATKSKYRILDINANKNKRGQSRLFNVLEAVKIFRTNNNQFFAALEEFGHRKSEVELSLLELGLQGHRLIKPERFIYHHNKHSACQQYVLTEKGHYYLEIAEWPEYKYRCGEYGKSFIASRTAMGRTR